MIREALGSAVLGFEERSRRLELYREIERAERGAQCALDDILSTTWSNPARVSLLEIEGIIQV